MNKLPGIITEIISEGQLSLIKIKAYESLFSAIVIDTPATAPYLHIGSEVNILFKENEVVIAKFFSGHISMQNKLDCVIKSMEQGKLLCKVILLFKSAEITSVITRQAAMQLDLNIGDQVTAMIKTNEISLSHD